MSSAAFAAGAAVPFLLVLLLPMAAITRAVCQI